MKQTIKSKNTNQKVEELFNELLTRNKMIQDNNLNESKVALCLTCVPHLCSSLPDLSKTL